MPPSKTIGLQLGIQLLPPIASLLCSVKSVTPPTLGLESFVWESCWLVGEYCLGIWCPVMLSFLCGVVALTSGWDEAG